MREGYFYLNRFFKKLEIPKDERTVVEECLVRGLARYYRHIYGYDKYGRWPVDILGERMHEPYIFGFGAVEIIRHPTLSLETRLKVVQYTLDQMRPLEEYGTPHGLLALASFLAKFDVLDPKVFSFLCLVGSFEPNLYGDWKPEEVRTLVDWLITKAGFPEEELLWWLSYLSGKCDSPSIIRPLADQILGHPDLSMDLKRALAVSWLKGGAPGRLPRIWEVMEKMLQGKRVDVQSLLAELDVAEIPSLPTKAETEERFETSLGFGRTLLVGNIGGFFLGPPYLRRRAILALVQFGEDPVSICKTYLDSDRGYYGDAINLGVADVIREYAGQMPQPVVQELIEQGLKIPQVNTRKAFYKLGADLFGSTYWQRALNDTAKTIREWAAKRISPLFDKQ